MEFVSLIFQVWIHLVTKWSWKYINTQQSETFHFYLKLNEPQGVADRGGIFNKSDSLKQESLQK